MMTKLKTLKDINKDYREEGGSVGGLYSHFDRELREEAIKWIKSKHCRNFGTAFDSDLFSNASEAMGAMKILKHFFNIKESDLDGSEIHTERVKE